ncbi:MAG: sulfotransferase [Chloroflexota bacterium]|nr:sulfotransferase [Chloroflexota bacterium]
MASVTQLTVSLIEPDAQWLLGREVKHIAAKQHHSTSAFRLVGWVVGRYAPVARVELLQDGKVIQSAAVDAGRPHNVSRFPGTAWAAESGWLMKVDSLAFETTIECELRAVLDDGTPVPLAGIRGQRQPLPAAGAESLQPLIVTSLGRSGTTWLMRLIAEHPEIVAYRRYPYEVRPGLYWTHMLRVLSERPDHSNPIAHPNGFFGDRSTVGANPFHSESLVDVPCLREWIGQTYPETLAQFCHASIESWYRCLAISQDQPNAAYFAEKHNANEYPVLLWEMYPGAREIFLVRDFRDMVSSALAFNAQRGFDDFGRQLVASDEEFIVRLRRDASRLLETWLRRSARSHLVRYEDLITSPPDTLRAVLSYLEIESSPATIDGMIERASRATPELQRHQTSSSPAASIGRWRRDLDPSLQEVAAAAFGDLLAKFGYDTT